MKKIKRFTILSVMALAVFFFFGTASVKASAETPEISVMESVSEEVIDSAEEYPQIYTMIEDDKTAVIELLDSSTLILTMYIDGEELASMNGWYFRRNNFIDMYANDNSYIGSLELFKDGTARYVDEDVETSQEPTSEYFGVIPETEASKWFEKYVAPYLMTVLSVLAAFCTCILIFITPIAKVVKKFKAAKDELVANNKENVAMRKGNDEWKDKTKAELQNEIVEMKNELRETSANMRKLLTVEKIAYEHNPSMVANGTAHKIAEVINSGEKKA